MSLVNPKLWVLAHAYLRNFHVCTVYLYYITLVHWESTFFGPVSVQNITHRQCPFLQKYSLKDDSLILSFHKTDRCNIWNWIENWNGVFLQPYNFFDIYSHCSYCPCFLIYFICGIYQHFWWLYSIVWFLNFTIYCWYFVSFGNGSFGYY